MDCTIKSIIVKKKKSLDIDTFKVHAKGELPKVNDKNIFFKYLLLL